MQILITDVVSIYHSTRTGSKKGYDSSPTYTNVNATISPTGTDLQPTQGGGAAYQLFEIFIPDITLSISTGDRVVTPSATYYVDGVPFTINNRYLQYIRLLAREVM